MKPNGIVDKYKARLVAKGFKQKEGLDFFDTYSLVMRITSIRMLIAIAALHNLEIHQMDVKIAFLNGELEEEIYMEQPERFKFDKVMLSNDFKINECDKCVYTKNTQSEYVIVCLYVDDILIIGSNNDVIKATKKMLTTYFDMKDMGVADVILGIKIAKTSSGLILSQCHYIENILKRFNQYDDSPIKTPVDLNLHLAKNNGPTIDQLEYSRIIGSLMYVMNCMCPDIAYVVNKLSIQPYLKDIVMQIGYLIRMIQSPQVDMYSQLVALRYHGNKVGEETEWLHNFLEDIPCWPKPVPAICIHCDSQSAIGRAQSSMYNGKSRHIRRRHNIVMQLLANGIISIDYVKSKDNLADPLTKGLSRDQVNYSSRGIRLRPITKEFHNGNPT
uniref:Reverse transcriptase Ty1/copia-type domain-containing protein n=1 Tax=Vitis vinifera TaxID=29760 RepID=A5BVF9_VITVI|nr:hypothetical protein VITISV_033879 [Vitis vinifera]